MATPVVALWIENTPTISKQVARPSVMSHTVLPILQSDEQGSLFLWWEKSQPDDSISKLRHSTFLNLITSPYFKKE